MDIAEKNLIAPKGTSDILPKYWEKSNGNFTANELIAAYFDGKKAGQKEEYEKFQSEFSINVKLATSIAEELLAIGTEKELKLHSIFLKVSALNSFEALFLVDKDFITTDGFREAYVLSRSLRNKYRTDRFNLSFSFTADSEEVDLNCLSADGFFMRYEKGKKA